MQTLDIPNPFHAPVYFVESCGSTQITARELIPSAPLSGTVVTASYQDKGRGRGTNRLWSAKPGENLLFTIMFHYENLNAVPKAFTLRIGLAVAEAVAQFVPALNERVSVKWPNDVMIGSRKVCGILAEHDGKYIITGIGINLNQLAFPDEISKKAVSVRQALQELQGGVPPVFNTHDLLEGVLPCLQKYVSFSADDEWNVLLQKRLYRRGERVSFIPGQAGSAEKIEGILEGIGQDGELLINTGTGKKSYITGELEHQY